MYEKSIVEIIVSLFEGVKAIETYLGYVMKKNDMVNRLDMSLKYGLDKKYSNYQEIIGNLDL